MIATWLLLGCTADAPTPPAPQPVASGEGRPDIVLILVSRLRADAGAEQALMEGLDRRPSHRFQAAYAQSPDDLPSVGSILTGRYPSAVPICGLKPADSEQPWCAQLPASRHTLPDVLSLYGYQTALFSDRSPLIGPRIRDRFAHASEIPLHGDPLATLQAQASRWWAQAPSPRLLTIFTSALDLRLAPETDDLPALYRQEARALGEGLGGLLAELDGSPWVVLAGSRGINLGEPGGYEGESQVPLSPPVILDRYVHVPLMIFDPTHQGRPRGIDTPVELIDIFPTLATLSGATPPAGLPGDDLLGALQEGTTYSELGDMLAVRQGGTMLTLRTYQHHGCALDPALTDALADLPLAGPHFLLHDVRRDPMQTDDLLTQRLQQAQSLREVMISLRSGAAAPAPEAITPARIWEYRMSASQGYW